MTSTSTSPSQSTVCALRRASKHYGATRALDDVDLEIPVGKVTAVLGPNGAGKTTAVKLLLGLCRPTSGSVELFGRSPNDAEAKMRCGAMMQIGALPQTLKVGELVHLFRSYYPDPFGQETVLEAAGLKDIENRQYGKLSGGQQQRVAFALSICGNPELLFMDEPTTGLDVETRRQFWTTMRRLTGEGRTLVLTTHYLEEADAVADRVVVLNHGKILADGSPSQIKERTAAKRIRARTSIEESKLRSLPAVRDVFLRGEQVEIATSEPEAVLRYLFELDRNLTDLEVTTAGLEEAFLSLTSSPPTDADDSRPRPVDESDERRAS